MVMANGAKYSRNRACASQREELVTLLRRFRRNQFRCMYGKLRGKVVS